MTLTDAGPLVALIDAGDSQHQRCMDATAELPDGPMITTWPCFTEAMYFLGVQGGIAWQRDLWKMVHDKRLLLHALTADETARCAELMEKYSDLPMDLADASLTAVAESNSLRRVFTIDEDFRIYRLRDGSFFEVVP
jgi:uncharacterized protein